MIEVIQTIPVINCSKSSYYRHQRRFIQLTAHTTTPSPSGGQRSGTGKRETGAGRQPARRAGRRTTVSHYPPAGEEQTDEEDNDTASTG